MTYLLIISMRAKEPCVFCKIIAGEIPSLKIFEDRKCIAFLDINPINPGHFLVIPKEHYKTITDMPKKLCKHIAGVVWDLTLKLQQTLDPEGVKVLQNNNEQAGQAVPHYHVHVIPRNKGDGAYYKEVWKTRKLSNAEMKSIQDILKS
jgi:histidine triad (HIT) family protein